MPPHLNPLPNKGEEEKRGSTNEEVEITKEKAPEIEGDLSGIETG
jgi:hypothetical protein